MDLLLFEHITVSTKIYIIVYYNFFKKLAYDTVPYKHVPVPNCRGEKK